MRTEKALPEVLSVVAAVYQIYLIFNLLAIVGLWYNRDINDGFILSNRNKQSESVRSIEELSPELLRQTSKRNFQNFLLEANQQLSIYNIAANVV